jgi:hypothetical protein
MWGNALAIKWGAAAKAVTLTMARGRQQHRVLRELRAGHLRARPWRTSANYKNKRFADRTGLARTSLIDGIKLAYQTDQDDCAGAHSGMLHSSSDPWLATMQLRHSRH